MPTEQLTVSPSSFLVVLAVWGEAYTRLFAEFALPALLSDRNLPALSRSRPSSFAIYTTAEDAERIRATPLYPQLAASIPVQFRDVEAALGVRSDKFRYDAMSAIHQLALDDAGESDAALVFLAPDAIWADGSLEAVARAADAGKRAVLQVGLRADEETAGPAMRRAFFDRTGPSAVPARDLVRLGLDHLHQVCRAWRWDAAGFWRTVSNCYWPIDDEGFLVRAFHLHPLMLYPERPLAPFVSTIDDDLLFLAVHDRETIHVVEDSDEVIHVELVPRDWPGELSVLAGAPSPRYIATWARGSATALHRTFFTSHTIRVHAQEISGRWRKAEAQSARVARRVRRTLGLRSAAVAALTGAFGLRRARILGAARAGGVGPTVLPAPPRWLRGLRAAALRFRLEKVALRLDALLASVQMAALDELFGHSIAARGLGVHPKQRARNRKQARKERKHRRRRRVKRVRRARDQFLKRFHRRQEWLRRRLSPSTRGRRS